jgi:hypothetical protein
MVPVGEAGPEARLGEGPEPGFRPVPAPDVVRPVVHRRDARVDRLGRRQAGPRVGVAGQEMPAEAGAGGEVARPVGAARGWMAGRGRAAVGPAAQQRVPHVPVRIDKPRGHDFPAGVYQHGFRNFWIPPDFLDDAVADVHVSPRPGPRGNPWSARNRLVSGGYRPTRMRSLSWSPSLAARTGTATHRIVDNAVLTMCAGGTDDSFTW